MTDQLGIGQALIDEANDGDDAGPLSMVSGATRPEQHDVERVSISCAHPGDAAVVVGAGQRRDEIDAAIGAPLDEAPARRFDQDVDLDAEPDACERRDQAVGVGEGSGRNGHDRLEEGLRRG